MRRDIDVLLLLIGSYENKRFHRLSSLVRVLLSTKNMKFESKRFWILGLAMGLAACGGGEFDVSSEVGNVDPGGVFNVSDGFKRWNRGFSVLKPHLHQKGSFFAA